MQSKSKRAQRRKPESITTNLQETTGFSKARERSNLFVHRR